MPVFSHCCVAVGHNIAKCVTILWFLALLAVSSSALAAEEVDCDTIDKTKTYQGLCIAGERGAVDCSGYVLVENFGDIPATGPLISRTPYFVKTPDVDISKLVNCSTFKAFVDFSNVKRDHLKSADSRGAYSVPLANTHENFYIKRGLLFVDMGSYAQRNKQYAQEVIDLMEKLIRERTDAVVASKGGDGTALFIEGIRLVDAMMIAHQYGGSYTDFRWDSEGTSVAFRGR